MADIAISAEQIPTVLWYLKEMIYVQYRKRKKYLNTVKHTLTNRLLISKVKLTYW